MADDLHLLKKLDCDTRYVLLTTSTSDIYVYLYHSSYTITSSDTTEIESGYIPLLDDVLASQTKTYTINENFRSINKMNDDIANYVNARPGYTSFNIINVSRNHKFVLQSKVFAAASKCCSNIYIDLGSVDTSSKGNYGGSIRLDSTDYGEIESLDINSGTILLEDNTTLIVKDFNITYATIDTYNKETDSSCSLNILIKNRIDIVNLAIYSTIFTTFSSYNLNATEYLNTKFVAAYIKIFGAEKISNEQYERILIQGFSKCSVNLIEAEDTVRYGGILKLDRMDKLTICGIKRTLKEVDPTIPMIKIGRVAVTNLHDLAITIDSSSTISSKYALIDFIEDQTGTTRSVNIYNSNVVNNASRSISIFRMTNVSINTLYFSDTYINENVILFDRNNASLSKITFNNCTVVGDNFELIDITKLTMIDCNFTISNKISLSSNYITISSGLYKFVTMEINSSDESPVNKVDMQKVEFVGGELNILNDYSNIDMPLFDNKSKFILNKFTISKYVPTLTNSVICTKKLNITNSKATKLLNVFVNYREENFETSYNINSSVSGTIMFTTGCTTDKFNITINDSEKFLNINPLNLTTMGESPTVTIKTNSPIKFKTYGFDSKYIHALFASDYSSTQSSTIDMYTESDEYPTKVLNDSEKLMTLSSEKLIENTSVEYIRYNLTPNS